MDRVLCPDEILSSLLRTLLLKYRFEVAFLYGVPVFQIAPIAVQTTARISCCSLVALAEKYFRYEYVRS